MSDSTATTPPVANPATQPGGAHDDPGDLQYGDFGLDGDMSEALGKALTNAGWTDGEAPADDTTIDADQADGASQPDPAPGTQPSAADAPGAGAGGDASGAAPDSASGPGQPAADEFDANSYFKDYFGTPLDRETAQQLAATLQDLQNLTPEQRAGLDQVLAGGQPNQYPATTGQPAYTGTQQQAYPRTDLQQPADDPAVAVLGPRPDDEYAAAQWDLTARAYNAQQQQLAEVQENIARTTQHQLEMQRQQETAIISQTAAAWREEYPFLSDAEYDAIADRAAKSGIFGTLAAQQGVAAATTQSLEQMLWTDTRLRERLIAHAASGRVAGDPSLVDPDSDVAKQQAAIEAQRKQLAASVAGGGGQAPSRDTHPGANGQVPTTPEGRKAALQAEIAAHMQG